MNSPTLFSEPPSLKGLSWRTIDVADLPAVFVLAEHCREIDGGLPFLNKPEPLRDHWLPESTIAAIGAFAGDVMAAAASVSLKRDPNSETARFVGQVGLEHRNRGLGEYLMQWSEAQARAAFRKEAGERRLQIATETLNDVSARLYAAHGFEQEMEGLVMQRDLDRALPDLAVPEDLTVETWQMPEARRYFEAYHAAFRDRPGFPGFSEAEWVENLTDDERFRPEWSLLASSGAVPVGFVTASREAPDGFVIQTGVIPSQRRRGICSALLTEVMRRMLSDGLASAQLTVHTDNPGAIRAYERLGFRTIGRRARYARRA